SSWNRPAPMAGPQRQGGLITFPAFCLSGLGVSQKMRRARLEVRGHHRALVKLQILQLAMRHERHEGEPAVDHHARLWSRGHDALHPSGEAIECRRGCRLWRAGKERDVLGPETKPHPFARLSMLGHVEALRPRFEHREGFSGLEHAAIENGLDADEACDVLRERRTEDLPGFVELL